MAYFTKESLELLRQRIDLVEVLSGHVELKAAGASYKALCPFHEEKTPSFVVRRGDRHYHCFGCGAHGDALEFYMGYLKLDFVEAVEALGQRFGVMLEREQGSRSEGSSRAQLREALAFAERLSHYILLHTEEGHEALAYLFSRGIDLTFVRRFQLGWAPSQATVLRNCLRELGVSEPVLQESGLIRNSGREFFAERILFPIRDAGGSCIGFSGRKMRESTFGGKYINTPETPLFKKSRVLFGLSECRRRIAKDRHAVLVEGQLDALRLIHSGLHNVVATLGTAFGEGHVEELGRLGVHTVTIAFDGDQAGCDAAVKAGDLLARRGIGVRIAALPSGSDPDSLVQKEGVDFFLSLLKSAPDYLTFLVGYLSKTVEVNTPAGKAEVARLVSERIQIWGDQVYVHESLRQLAQLLQLPPDTVGASHRPRAHLTPRSAHAEGVPVDGRRIVEMDVLRWLVLLGGQDEYVFTLATLNVAESLFSNASCRTLFRTFMEQRPSGLLDLAAQLSETEQQTLSELFERRIDRDKAHVRFPEAIGKLLESEWKQRREEVLSRMTRVGLSEEEMLALAKEFDQIKREEPKVKCPT